MVDNNSRTFESRPAFWALICIIVSLTLLSAANYYAGSYSESSSVSLDGNGQDQTEYDQGVMTEGYKYEVIAERGVVNVYSIDPSGEKAFFCETEIPYALLSENDKRLMRRGVTLNTMEELNSILQDFES